MCVSNEQCHRQRKYFLTACRQGNIFPVYDRANARQPGKSLIFLACTADCASCYKKDYNE